MWCSLKKSTIRTNSSNCGSLKTRKAEAFDDFQIIICGKNIAKITNLDKINAFIEKAGQLGVSIVACGFSLKKFKVDATKLSSKIKIVENGILHNFQLQDKGYKSLSL